MYSLALPAMGLAAVVGMVAGLRRRRTVVVSANEHAAAVIVDHHVRRWRGVGLAIGLGLASLLILTEEGLGRWAALAPAALGIGVLLGAIVGECSAPVLRDRVRSAGLETRRMSQMAPRPLVRLLAAASVTFLAVMAYGVMRGSTDDVGRSGRSLIRTCLRRQADGIVAEVGSSVGPWPGRFYVFPVMAAIGLAALLTLGAGLAVSRRPRASVEDRSLDSLLRVWGVGNVLTAMLMTLLGTIGPFAFVMSAGLFQGLCRSRVDAVLASVFYVVGTGATGAAAGLLGVLLSPARIMVAKGERPSGPPEEVIGVRTR